MSIFILSVSQEEYTDNLFNLVHFLYSLHPRFAKLVVKVMHLKILSVLSAGFA